MVQIEEEAQTPFLYCWNGAASATDEKGSQPRQPNRAEMRALAFSVRAASKFILLIMSFSIVLDADVGSETTAGVKKRSGFD